MKISVIGTGNMGSAVALGLLGAGHQVTVYNRTRARAERLANRGVVAAGSAAECIQASECTVVVLFDAASTRQVLLGDEVRTALSGFDARIQAQAAKASASAPPFPRPP